MHIGFVRYGDVAVEWDERGNMKLVRQDNGQHITLSVSEWAFLLKVAELRGWPVAPPAGPGEQAG
jgi:hypothetical protein